MKKKVYVLLSAAQGASSIEHTMNAENFHLFLTIISLAEEAGYTHILYEHKQTGKDTFKPVHIEIEQYLMGTAQRFRSVMEDLASRLTK